MSASSGIVVALVALAAVIGLIPIALGIRRHLHILQLEEYSSRRFLRWWASERAGAARRWRWTAVVLLALIAVAAFAGARLVVAVCAALWVATALGMARELRPQPAKKPLVYTARIRRLIGGTIVVSLAVAAVTAAAVLLTARNRDWFAAATVSLTLPVGILLAGEPLLVVCGNLLAFPMEAALRRWYLRDAHRRLRRLAPKLIAITGSFGKTTTKELLASVLATRFSTVKTPESWNTLMGVTRTIRERLGEEHEVFVVEMGAYQRGEIAALCELTGPPDIGILTGINEQHLERFGGIQNTIRAKYELIEAVKPGGLAIFNADNAYCRELAGRATHTRVLRVGLEREHGALDYTAGDIDVSPEGTRFTVHASGQAMPFRTRLLGEHFILNILAATAAAIECGMTLQQVAAAVAAMPPVAHRLQLIPSPGGITTIDDAYSANPDGARAALRVLSRMNGGRRILVTPGFVELGDREAAFNRDLGELAASACDMLVLVGPRRTLPIREGAVTAGMDVSRIEVVDSVAAARSLLLEVAGPGDTILFENDLPDNYDE